MGKTSAGSPEKKRDFSGNRGGGRGTGYILKNIGIGEQLKHREAEAK